MTPGPRQQPAILFVVRRQVSAAAAEADAKRRADNNHGHGRGEGWSMANGSIMFSFRARQCAAYSVDAFPCQFLEAEFCRLSQALRAQPLAQRGVLEEAAERVRHQLALGE